ncbi:hypothetical protein CMU00_15950 [Elizabethkingia anophelis]|nr:hypothetical protein [Elizabethkingia anophelis]
MKRILIFLLVGIFILSPAQAKKTSYEREFVYNVSIGAVIGAVGAIINKKKEQDFNKVFFKGLYQGALGGYITFESKRLLDVAERNNDWKIIWGAKLVNAAGVSIKENAALNKDFWEKWHFNIGFNRIEFETKEKFKVHYKIMPIALAYTIAYANRSKFELDKTLKIGEVIFSGYDKLFTDGEALGFAFSGGILLSEPYKNDFPLLIHEIVHVYQSNDFSQTEAFLNKPLRYTERNNVLKSVNKFIHYDIGQVVFLAFYGLEYGGAKYYYDNIFEREAGFYSGTFDSRLLKR